jgi:hypothetical protein
MFLSIFIRAGSLFLITAMCGCMDTEAYYRRQVTFGYVLDLEDPDKIAAWTMEQTVPSRILDGIGSLQHIVRSPLRWSPPQRKRAGEALLGALKTSRSGWPEVELDRHLGIVTPNDAYPYLTNVIRQFLISLKKEMETDQIVHSIWLDAVAVDSTLVRELLPKERGLFQ